MKVTTFPAFLLLAAQAILAEEFKPDELIRKVWQADIGFLAERLALRHKDRGMGSYELSRGRLHFYAYAFSGDDENPSGKSRRTGLVEQPVTLTYYASQRHPASPAAITDWNSDWNHISAASAEGKVVTLHATLFIEHGVAAASLQTFIARFVREIDGFNKLLRTKPDLASGR